MHALDQCPLLGKVKFPDAPLFLEEFYGSIQRGWLRLIWIFDKAKRSLANKEETGTWELSDAKSLPLS